MNNQSKNNRTTNRPSFKQSRRGRAYYSAQSARYQRASQDPRSQQAQEEQRQAQQQDPSQSTFFESDPAKKVSFEVAKMRHIRWEVWFILGVILIIALIFGCGGLIAAKRSQDALIKPTASITKTSPAASAQTPETNEAGDADADAVAKQPETVDPALTARNAALALDPNNVEWDAVDDGRKVVYLTFDDGPSVNTQAVLDILDRYGCKATFFTVGHNDDYFPMIAEAYKRGHTVGMHTYSHDYAQVYASDEAYFADLEQMCQIVQEQIGYVPVFVRFPGGSSNSISTEYNEGIMSRLVDELRARGYQYFDWDLSFGDGSEHSTEELIEYACEPLDKNKIVILGHDSATKQTTIEALPSIIEHYQSLGYTFEALSRDAVQVHHKVAN